MNTTNISLYAGRLMNHLQNSWKHIRRLRFRQVMGAIIIIKTFNPLWLLLTIGLFAVLLIQDLREQYHPAFELISNNYDAILNQDLRGLQAALNTAQGAMQGISDILSVLSSIVNAIIGFVNQIIEVIAWLLGLGKINLSIHIPIPNLMLAFQPFNDIAIHFKGLFEGIALLFTVTKMVLVDLWERFKFIAFTGILWAFVSIFASIYSEISRGLEMIRGDTTPGRTKGNPPGGIVNNPGKGLVTPPVILVSQSQITLPVMAIDSAESHGGQPERTFAFRDRYLLSAQGIWSDRHAPLFFQQLTDRVDEAAWAQFWQSLLHLGLDPAQVKMVISADTRSLEPGIQRYLPGTALQQSVETTFISSQGAPSR